MIIISVWARRLDHDSIAIFVQNKKKQYWKTFECCKGQGRVFRTLYSCQSSSNDSPDSSKNSVTNEWNACDLDWRFHCPRSHSGSTRRMRAKTEKKLTSFHDQCKRKARFDQSKTSLAFLNVERPCFRRVTNFGQFLVRDPSRPLPPQSERSFHVLHL